MLYAKCTYIFNLFHHLVFTHTHTQFSLSIFHRICCPKLMPKNSRYSPIYLFTLIIAWISNTLKHLVKPQYLLKWRKRSEAQTDLNEIWNEDDIMNNKIYAILCGYMRWECMLIPIVFIIGICNDVYIMTKYYVPPRLDCL